MKKAGKCYGNPTEWFQILKMMLLKCCSQDISKFGKFNSVHGTGKCQFSFGPQRKEMPKKLTKKQSSNYLTIALISHANQIVLKILQASL